VSSPAARSGRELFFTGLGIGQIASWGTLYYSFPLIAESCFWKPGLIHGASLELLTW
jgi:hypothetical protein